MKLGFYARWNEKRLAMAERFAAGVRKYGDEIEIREMGEEAEAGDDVAVIIGNKLQLDVHASIPVIRFDKSYPLVNLRRHHDYSRVSIGIPHPTPYLGKLNSSSDRRRQFGWEARPWQQSGDRVLIFGGSQSFYNRAGIEDVQAHLQELANRVRAVTSLRVAFRPKPNMARHLQPLRGVEAVDPFAFLRPLLADCRSIVVEESAACIEALFCGVPAIVLGDAPTKSISSNEIGRVDSPFFADRGAINRFLDDLAYFQYSGEEHESGMTWRFLRRLM